MVMTRKIVATGCCQTICLNMAKIEGLITSDRFVRTYILMYLYCERIPGMRHYVQKLTVTDEVESWEKLPLCFKIVLNKRTSDCNDIFIFKCITSRLLNTCSSKVLQSSNDSRTPEANVANININLSYSHTFTWN